MMYIGAGSALGLRTVTQQEKKQIVCCPQVEKLCPRTHSHVLFLWRIVIIKGQWRIHRHVLGDILKKQHTRAGSALGLRTVCCPQTEVHS